MEKDTEKIIDSIISPEKEFEIVIDGIKQTIYWRRITFEDRIYFKAYFKKKLKEAKDQGFLYQTGTHKEERQLDGLSSIISLDPYTVDTDTLRLVLNGYLLQPHEYSYAPEIRAITFSVAPRGKLEIEYSYFDREIYDQIFNTTFLIAMVFLCSYKDKERDQRFFSNINEVTKKVSIEVLSSIISEVFVTPEDLKKALGPQPSSEGGGSPENSG